MLWHAYIDESGDRGRKRRPVGTPIGTRAGSSRTFAVTAVLVPDGSGPAYLRSWDQAAAATSRRNVHWKDLKATGARKHLVQTLAGLLDVRTISVVLCKWHLKNVNALTDPGYFYHWTARLLLERLSWFGKQMNATVAPTLAQVKGHPQRMVIDYFRRLGKMPTSIEWNHLRMPPSFSTPRTRRLLQLADVASGAVFAAFEPDDFGFSGQTYLSLLKPVMWVPPGRALWKYGLKGGPYSDPDCEKEYPWLSGFYGRP